MPKPRGKHYIRVNVYIYIILYHSDCPGSLPPRPGVAKRTIIITRCTLAYDKSLLFSVFFPFPEHIHCLTLSLSLSHISATPFAPTPPPFSLYFTSRRTTYTYRGREADVETSYRPRRVCVRVRAVRRRYCAPGTRRTWLVRARSSSGVRRTNTSSPRV